MAGYVQVVGPRVCKGLNYAGPGPCDAFDNDGGGLEAEVQCPAGKRPLGGGHELRQVSFNPNGTVHGVSRPTDNGTGWRAEFLLTNNQVDLRAWRSVPS